METNLVSVGVAASDVSPSKEWTTEKLAEFIRDGLEAVTVLAKKTAVQVFWIGAALDLVAKKLTKEKAKGGFRGWCEAEGIALATANQCLAVYRRCKKVSKLEGLTVTEAKQTLGIVKGHARKSPEILTPSKKLLSLLDQIEALLASGPKMEGDDAGDAIDKALSILEKIKTTLV